nr:hypothetical protein 14 [bacterium]
MNFLDKVIAPVFPNWALSRVRAKCTIGLIERAYEAAKPSRLRKKRKDRGSGDAVVGKAADLLRIQVRHLDENHDLARGVLNCLVNNVVGTGIRVEPQVKDKNGELIPEFNQQLLQLFDDWEIRPEVTWEMHWNQLQRLAARSWFRDGEVRRKKFL